MLGLTWTSSNTAVVSLSSDDPPVLSALAPGRVTIAAGGASAEVVVMAGDQFPVGTTAWSTPLSGGYHSIIPAVPSATGVADVFAVQTVGETATSQSISAITSEGAVAWTAVVSPPAAETLPDFQGGMVVLRRDNSIVRLNGMTGAESGSYSVGANKEVAGVVVHLDGTIFAAVRDPAAAPEQMGSLVGIDPATGGQKFSVPVNVQSTIGFLHRPIIAGDGYAYVPFATREFCGYFCPTPYQLNLLRVSSAGAASTIGLTSWLGPWGDAVPVSVSMITNADTGVYVSIRTNDGFLSATTNGLNVSLGGAPVLPGQEGLVRPVLQAQDGSFVGEAHTPGGRQMVAFEANGGIRWVVPGESPLMALEDAEVRTENGLLVTRDGVLYSRQTTQLIQSWLGLSYDRGAHANLQRTSALPVRAAGTSYWARQGGNPSQNGTAVAECPCMIQSSNPASIPAVVTEVFERQVDHSDSKPLRPAVAKKYLLLEADKGENRGPNERNNVGLLFNWAALTIRTQILARGGDVDMPKRVSSVPDVASQLISNGTIDGGVYLFSHGGALWKGGPPAIFVGESAPSASNPYPNLTAGNVSQLSNSKLGPNAEIYIYACHGGAGGEQSIAQAIANRLKRWVWASTTGMFFSSTPNAEQPASPNPQFSSLPVYMVPWKGFTYDSFGNHRPDGPRWRIFFPANR